MITSIAYESPEGFYQCNVVREGPSAWHVDAWRNVVTKKRRVETVVSRPKHFRRLAVAQAYAREWTNKDA